MKDAIPWNWTPGGTAFLVGHKHPDKPIVAVARVDLFGEALKILVEEAMFGDLHRDGETLAHLCYNEENKHGISIRNLQLERMTAVAAAGTWPRTVPEHTRPGASVRI